MIVLVAVWSSLQLVKRLFIQDHVAILEIDTYIVDFPGINQLRKSNLANEATFVPILTQSHDIPSIEDLCNGFSAIQGRTSRGKLFDPIGATVGLFLLLNVIVLLQDLGASRTAEAAVGVEYFSEGRYSFLLVKCKS